MSKPLEGILVVALEQAVAAPYASCRLADAGARVIKLERAEGDFARGYDRYAKGSSSYFVWLNRGKESCRVDLKTPEDLQLVHNMIAEADVFIQNLGPGATERLGLGSESLRQKHSRLITCDISGYGDIGPMKDRKAYDLLVQAESGLAAITGSRESPSRVGVSVCDIATGMHAYEAILEGLLARARTGKGMGIKLSLFHSLMDWMNVPWIAHNYGGRAPGRVGLAHPSIAPYGLFQCQDGSEFLISIQNEAEWRNFCSTVLELPELPLDPRFRTNADRAENREATDSVVQCAIGKVTGEVLMDRLHRANIAYGRLSQIADLGAHPQARYITVDSPGGEIEMFSPAAIFSDGERAYGAVPSIGSHDQEIRGEFATPSASQTKS